MKFHNIHFHWTGRDEVVCVIGFACGRVSYRPESRWLYSFRLFLGCFKIELLWKTKTQFTPGIVSRESRGQVLH